jgi:hypothetical protein
MTGGIFLHQAPSDQDAGLLADIRGAKGRDSHLKKCSGGE